MKIITPKNTPATSRQLTMFDEVTPAAPTPTLPAPSRNVRKKAPSKTATPDAAKIPLEPIIPPAIGVTVTVRVSVNGVSQPGAKTKGKRTPHALLAPAALAQARENNRRYQKKSRAKKIKDGFARMEVILPNDLEQRVRAQMAKERMEASRWVARELEFSLASMAAISGTADPSRN